MSVPYTPGDFRLLSIYRQIDWISLSCRECGIPHRVAPRLPWRMPGATGSCTECRSYPGWRLLEPLLDLAKERPEPEAQAAIASIKMILTRMAGEGDVPDERICNLLAEDVFIRRLRP